MSIESDQSIEQDLEVDMVLANDQLRAAKVERAATAIPQVVFGAANDYVNELQARIAQGW